VRADLTLGVGEFERRRIGPHLEERLSGFDIRAGIGVDFLDDA
jgi:hypothetical protein